MARLVPADLPSEAQHSERVVHEALALLPDSWTVLWNIPVGVFGRPKPGFRQLDFLIIHPRQGLIVLEVKGGEVSIREGTWYTKPRGGEPVALRRSPFEQATDARYQLSRYLAEHLSLPSKCFSIAVALPDCTVEVELGPDAPREIVLDAGDLNSPQDALRRVTAHWQAESTLSEETVGKIVALLKPSLDVTVVLAATAARTEQALARETRRQVAFVESQVETWEELLRSSRAVVIGGAGTGKTVLATERARKLADAGQKTLLLCHRAAVLSYIATLLEIPPEERPFKANGSLRLQAAHWRGLASGLAAARGEKEPSYHSPTLPDWFLETADALELHYDAIVVDEGQEFTPLQFEALSWLLNDPEQGPFYVFADPFQHSGLYSARSRLEREKQRGRYQWLPPFDGSLLRLTENCRNSRPIAELAKTLYPLPAASATVTGAKPQFITRPDKEAVLRTSLERVRALMAQDGFQPNQILVALVGITDADFERAARRASLSTVCSRDVYRFPLTPIDRRVAFGTTDEVQGLEAEVVVAAHATNETVGIDQVRDLYVAATRARSMLIVVSTSAEEELQRHAAAAIREASEPRDES